MSMRFATLVAHHNGYRVTRLRMTRLSVELMPAPFAIDKLVRAGTRFDCVLIGRGPLQAELEDRIARLGLAGRVRFELDLIELTAGDVVRWDGYDVAAVEVSHRGPALGYAIYEQERPGVFDPAAAQRLGLTPGPEFGQVQRGATVKGVRPDQVLGPPRPGRKVVLSGDTTPCESLRIAAHRADLLLHEATFANEESERAAETRHSTAAQAATLAREAEVTLLALTHFSTRYAVGLLRDEARAIFANTVLPRDFDAVEIPFPERGRPELIRWERSPHGAKGAAGPGSPKREEAEVLAE